MALEDSTPRHLPERTGRHVCILCLGEVPDEQYFANDHLCDDCAAKDDYPLKTTPNKPDKE
jgi:hypothetical protein